MIKTIENKVVSKVYENEKGYDYLIKVYGGVRDCRTVKDFMKKQGYQDVYGAYIDEEEYEFGFNKN